MQIKNSLTTLLALLAILSLLAACGRENPKLPPAPLEVSTITVKAADIEVTP